MKKCARVQHISNKFYKFKFVDNICKYLTMHRGIDCVTKIVRALKIETYQVEYGLVLGQG